jgi:hypothetical protein
MPNAAHVVLEVGAVGVRHVQQELVLRAAVVQGGDNMEDLRASDDCSPYEKRSRNQVLAHREDVIA